MRSTECVRCGYCCSVAPCPYGHGTPCEYLTENGCSKHDEIVALERGSRYPMFGSGCSSTLFNTRRQSVINALRR